MKGRYDRSSSRKSGHDYYYSKNDKSGNNRNHKKQRRRLCSILLVAILVVVSVFHFLSVEIGAQVNSYMKDTGTLEVAKQAKKTTSSSYSSSSSSKNLKPSTTKKVTKTKPSSPSSSFSSTTTSTKKKKPATSSSSSSSSGKPSGSNSNNNQKTKDSNNKPTAKKSKPIVTKKSKPTTKTNKKKPSPPPPLDKTKRPNEALFQSDRARQIQKDHKEGTKQCVAAIQKRILSLFQPALDVQPLTSALIIDPAYHGNVGDNMMALGEFILAETLHLSPTYECGLYQSKQLNPPCGNFSTFDKTTLAIWQGGGNWGDRFGAVQNVRVGSYQHLMQNQMTVLGMPQSLNFIHGEESIRNSSRIVQQELYLRDRAFLAWRQRDSYETALQLYPNVNHILSPDVAFMIGPVGSEHVPIVYDIMFLLRSDKEGLAHNMTGFGNMTLEERIDNLVQEYSQPLSSSSTKKKEKKKKKVSHFTYYTNWRGRKYGANRTLNIKHSTVNSNYCDIQNRIGGAVEDLFGRGKVIVTDFMHGSVLSFLMSKPHIFIDQVYGKTSQSRAAALETSEICMDRQLLRYDEGFGLEDAVKKAIRFLSTYE